MSHDVSPWLVLSQNRSFADSSLLMCKCTQPHGCKLSQHVTAPGKLGGMACQTPEDPVVKMTCLSTMSRSYQALLRWFVRQSYPSNDSNIRLHPRKDPDIKRDETYHSSRVLFAKVVIFGWRYYKWHVSRSQLWGGPAKAAWAPLIYGNFYGHRMPWGKGCLGHSVISKSYFQ